jgi:hypothetical protein
MSRLLAVFALVAVLAMHGIHVHGERVATEHRGSSAAWTAMVSGMQHPSDHGAHRQMPAGAETAALACAFAVLVGRSRRIGGLMAIGRSALENLRWARQLSAPPDPPVPRLVAA